MLKRSSFILLPSILFGIDNMGVYGKTYDIAEVHLLEKIKSAKIRPIPNTKELLMKTSLIDLDLPIAKKDNFRKEKPNFTVPADFVIDGKVLAKKGEVINILDRIKSYKQYIICSDEMIKDYVDYAKHNNVVFLISKGNVLEMQDKYPEFYIYGGLPQVVKSLRVKKIPSIVYQSGNELVIVEKKWEKPK